MHDSNGIDIIVALLLIEIKSLGKNRIDLVLELKVLIMLNNVYVIGLETKMVTYKLFEHWTHFQNLALIFCFMAEKLFKVKNCQGISFNIYVHYQDQLILLLELLVNKSWFLRGAPQMKR